MSPNDDPVANQIGRKTERDQAVTFPSIEKPNNQEILSNGPLPATLSSRQRWLIAVLLALLLWLPRGLALDHFVAVDERSWLTRSGNFYEALATGNLAATFQRYHPGVTTMWLGVLGFLWQYPTYPAEVAGQISSMTDGIEDFLNSQGYSPLALLAAGRTFVVLATVLLFLIAFWLATDLLGWLPALVGILLAGLEPFGLGLTRMLHVDGLSSLLMLVSLLAYLRYRAPNPAIAGRRRDLLLSAIIAGLGWLTKSPALFLGPMLLLLAGIDVLRAWIAQRRSPDAAQARTLTSLVREHVRDLAIWGVVAALVFMICWPAMWVRPVQSLQSIFTAAEESVEAGHDQRIYFNGKALWGDPGANFYPITYAWHTTPVTLLGLVLALVAGIVGARRRTLTWQSTALLLLYALIFSAVMTLGSKKFDRYLLPAYFPLALVAGVGWYAFALKVAASTKIRQVALWLLALVLAAQAAFSLPHFPYYFTYANPLLGGNARAPEVLMIGLGEGIDEAARYLNGKPNAEQLRVAAWYKGGSFDYIFKGQEFELEGFYLADYAVLYIHQWQRQVPNLQMLDYFAQITPEYTVRLHGLDYAWVYNLQDEPPPSYFTDWGEAIRLVETQLPLTSLQPGDEFVARLRMQSIGTVDTNLNAVIRLIDGAGNEVMRDEGWPYGSPTSTWQPGDIYVDGHVFTLPADTAAGYLRVELGLYDADAQRLVTPMVAGTETPRGEYVGVGYVSVGLAGKEPALLQSPPHLGEQIALVGARLQGADLSDSDVPRVEAMPVLPLLLAWQALRPPAADYVAFIHLIAPDGTVAKQYDRAPLLGVAPTTLWREGDTLLDAYDLDIPADLPPGEYRVLVGLYDLATLTRLPVQIDGVPAGDSIHVATVTVP